MAAVRVQLDQYTVNPGVGEQLPILLDCWRAVLTFQSRGFAGWRVNGAGLDASAAAIVDGTRIGMEFGRLVVGPDVQPVNLNTTLYIQGDGTEAAVLYVTVQREYYDLNLPDLQRQSRAVASRYAADRSRERNREG